MSKSNKSQRQQSNKFNSNFDQNVVNKKQKFSISLPEVINMDVLYSESDEELHARLDNLYSERDKAVAAEQDPQPWEVEICYVKREVLLRRQRRELHEKYVSQLSVELARNNEPYPDYYPTNI